MKGNRMAFPVALVLKCQTLEAHSLLASDPRAELRKLYRCAFCMLLELYYLEPIYANVRSNTFLQRMA